MCFHKWKLIKRFDTYYINNYFINKYNLKIKKQDRLDTIDTIDGYSYVVWYNKPEKKFLIDKICIKCNNQKLEIDNYINRANNYYKKLKEEKDIKKNKRKNNKYLIKKYIHRLKQ